jgi:ABC-2 type transport system permease protein
MIKGVWTIAVHDLRMWSRMPIAVVSTLLPPVAMALLLVVLSMAVTQQPVALVVECHGQCADRMARIIKNDDDAYLLTVTDAATAQRMLANQQVAAVITIPANFEKKICDSIGSSRFKTYAERTAPLPYTLNNVDVDFADDIRRSVDRSAALFDAPQMEKEEELETATSLTTRQQQILRGEFRETLEDEAMEASGVNPFLINIDEHDLRKTDVEWLHYQVIPALVLLVLSVGLVGTALLCGQDIERKTARFLVLTPQASWALVLGRLLGGFLASMLALIPAVLICVFFNVIHPPLAHWPALAAVFAATALFAAGAGSIFGVLFTGSRTIAMASSVTATYLFLLGGGFTTIAFLPEWLQVLASFAPTRYAIDGMRQALFYDTLDGVPTDLLVLSLSAVAACALGSLCVRRAWSN